MHQQKLFTTVNVGEITVPHRVVLAPLTRFRAKDDQVPKDFVADYYSQRATCQGLLITEATSIHQHAAPFEGSPGIYNEKQIEAWRRVVQRVHETGGKIFMQLWHTGRTAHSSLLDGRAPVSSSAVRVTDPVRGKYSDALGRRESDIPRALEEHEVKDIVQQFVTAAHNAVFGAGFDGVEIHGANGYLVDQFLRDGVNQRTDSYGGTIEKRCKFAVDILEGVAKKIGAEKVGIRLNPFGNFNSMCDSDPVGLFSHLFRTLSKKLPQLAYIHITDYCTGALATASEDPIAQLRKLWSGTWILNLTRMSRDMAIQVVAEGRADLVAIGRDFLANPDLPLRLFQNLPLNPQDVSTFYTHDKEGYTDYPFYKTQTQLTAEAHWNDANNLVSIPNA